MRGTMEAMLDKENRWAVIGATANRQKYGYKILQILKTKGYTVYPVNPVYDEIEGEICYNALIDLPETVDCVSMVVSPERSLQWLDSIKTAGVKRVWFQPGTFDEAVIEQARTLGLEMVHGPCVLAELKARP